MTIRVYTGYRERRNAHLYRDFTVVSSLPKIGDKDPGYSVDGEITDIVVTAISPAQLDCEQSSDRVYDYDYFEVEYSAETSGTYYESRWVALEKKFSTQVKFPGSDGWEEICRVSSEAEAEAEIESQREIEDDGDCEYRIVEG